MSGEFIYLGNCQSAAAAFTILETSTGGAELIQERRTQWAAGGFEEFLNIMNFYVFLIVWDNRVNKL